MYPETLYSIIYLNTFKNKVFIKQRNMKAFLQPFSAIGRSAVGLFSKIFYCFSKSGYCFTTCKCEGSLGIRRPCRVTRTCNFLSSYLVLTPVGSKGYGSYNNRSRQQARCLFSFFKSKTRRLRKHFISFRVPVLAF